MSAETEIQTEIESLRNRFSDTKALYREVCGLLFFRHGITPTASKLYQYVRKGSMSAPAEALAKFWEELRSKARVQIDHPDLPEALKVATADAVQTLWTQAAELARAELAAVRVEVQAEASKASADLEDMKLHAAGLEARALELQGGMAELERQRQVLASELETERRAHAGTAARAETLQLQVADLQGQQAQVRKEFAAELEKGRVAIEAANERAAGAERRALREIEQERAARAMADKQLEGLRAKLADSERKAQATALEFVTTNTRLTAELDAARLQARQLDVAHQGLQQQLQAIQAEAAHHKTEAETLRNLVAQFKPQAAASQPRARRAATGGAKKAK